MKRDRLHDWMLKNCPAYAGLDESHRAQLLDQALAEERADRARERKQMLGLAALAVVVGLATIPLFDHFPIGVVIWALIAAGVGVSQHRVAARLELRVRAAAQARAHRLIATRQHG
jgi:hypothetical protein